MDDFRSAILDKHSTWVFTSMAFILALATFVTSSPSFIPLVLLIATVQVYGRIFLRRRLAFARGFLLWFAISVGMSLSRLRPSLNALSSIGISLLVLQGMTSLSSLIALITVLLDIRICMQFTSPWAQVAIFPALWTTSWWAASLASPIGRLALWSPTVGTDAYRWLLPWVGTLGIDWVTAAWAVVISQAVGAWFMGSEKPDPIRLIDVESPTNPTPRATLYLTALLAALTIPSFVINPIPLAVIHDDTTPLIVGCVIPPHRRYKHPHLVLKDFIEESKKLATADVIVWPEGAITFQNDQEKETAFAQLASAVSKAHVAVSFEEYYSDVGDSRPSRLRTGLAIISPHNSTPQLTYYKRHLVPIAESYSLTHATRPPSLYTLELPKPSGYNKTDWAPPPSYTRPISLTASICLDFAIPSPFIGLAHRPGLILAPARTWHPTIAMTMWEQAKQRAAEIGSPILWCDGGDGGVSGVAGQGFSEVTQVGEGSWTREIALHYPLTTRRTLYGLIGELPVILFVWAIVCLGGIGNPLRFKGNIGAGLNWTWVVRLWGDLRGKAGRWFGRVNNPERQHLLE